MSSKAATAAEVLKDHRLTKAVGRGKVKHLTDDYAIVFVPSTSYYNRGRNTIASSINIVFRKFVSFDMDLQSRCVAGGVLPTKDAINEAIRIAERIVKTVTTIEKYIEQVGSGVVLRHGDYGMLEDNFGTPVVFGNTVWNSHLVEKLDHKTYVTVTPESRAADEDKKRIEAEEKRNAAIDEWTAAYEAADAAGKRELVGKLIRVQKS